MPTNANKTCPSFVAVPGALEIGSIDGAGVTIFHEEPSIFSEQRLDELSDDITPVEHQVRLAGVCMKGACGQWEHGGCSLAARLSATKAFELYTDYANCPITSTCRWRAEQGPLVCPKCTLVLRYGSQNS